MWQGNFINQIEENNFSCLTHFSLWRNFVLKKSPQRRHLRKVIRYNSPVKPKVVIATGTDKRELVRQVIGKLGEDFKKKVKEAKKIFVHPNLVSNSNQSAATHVEAVRGVLDHISLITDKQILIGDAGYHDTKKAFENFDYHSLERSGNIKLVDLNDDETIETYAYTTDMEKRPIGFSKTVAESDLNIVVIPAKMHSYYTVSLSLKTHIVGGMVVDKSPFGIYARWPWLHTGYRQAHLTLAENYLKLPAQLVIIDGTSAMQGNGPASGEEIDLGWVLTSFEPVAADFVAAYLMGFDPVKEIGYLNFLSKEGFLKNIKDIEIEGASLDSLRKEIDKPDSYPEILAWK